MNDIRHYSDFLHCVHDEPEPYGQLGRGTHYSILRAPVWHDSLGRRIDRAKIHDFAVIWDEDHDDRVIGVVERMYFAGLLYPVLFVGERKGSLTVVLSEDYAGSVSESLRADYERVLSKILSNVPTDGGTDTWGSEVGVFEEGGNPFAGRSGPSYLRMLINDEPSKVDTYLRNIHNLWQLGHKEYVLPKPVIPEPIADRQPLFGKQAKAQPSIQRSIFSRDSAST